MSITVVTATVLQLASHPSPGELWSLETTVTVETQQGTRLEFELPGGTIGDTTVVVSHQPRLERGQTYELALVDTPSGPRALSAVPLTAPVIPEDALFYELAGSAWPTAEVAIPFSLSADSFPASMDDDALLDAFIEGVEVWNRQGGARVLLPWEPYTSSTQYGGGSNGINAVMWDGYHWGSTLAISARTIVGSEIVDCDMQFFGSNNNGSITWNVDPAGAPDGQNAFRHTLVHELGHCIGISHSQLEAALMSSYAPDDQGPSSWELHSDDQAAVQAIYGRAHPELEVVDARLDGGELELDIDNVGDWDAWEVSVDLSGELVPDEAVVEDNLPVGLATVAVPVTLGDCGDLPVDVVMVDRQGELWESVITVTVDCAEAGLDDPESGGAGCSCDTAPTPGWWWVAGPLVVAMRRRFPRS